MAALSSFTWVQSAPVPPHTMLYILSNKTGEDSDAQRASRMYKAANDIVIYCYPIIFCLGVIGNSVAFAVLFRLARQSSTYTYLLVLSASDICFLLTSSTAWFIFAVSRETIDLRLITNCNFVLFCNYFPSHLSVWLIVAVSVERAIVIFFPLKSRTLFGPSQARRVVACLVVFLVLLNSHMLGGLENANDNQGTILYDDVCLGRTPALTYYHFVIFPWIDSAVYSFIPTTIILTVNSIIIAKIKKNTISTVSFINSSRRTDSKSNSNHVSEVPISRVDALPVLHQHLSCNRVSVSEQIGNPSVITEPATAISLNRPTSPAVLSVISSPTLLHNHNAVPNLTRVSPKPRYVTYNGSRALAKNSRRLTLMALTLSFTFLTLTLPTSIFHAAFYNQTALLRDPVKYSSVYLAIQVMSMLMHLNHCLNFILYTVASTKFRDEFKKSLACCFRNRVHPIGA